MNKAHFNDPFIDAKPMTAVGAALCGLPLLKMTAKPNDAKQMTLFTQQLIGSKLSLIHI